MAITTAKGWLNKQLTDDGRESPKKMMERQTLTRKETKTKKKRAKKAEKELLEMVLNS